MPKASWANNLADDIVTIGKIQSFFNVMAGKKY
jgi:hypothetical protein